MVTYFGPATNPAGSLESLRGRVYDRLHRASARRAARVLTASTVVKRRVVEVYGIPGERVAVIPLAPDPAFRRVEDVARRAAVRRSALGADSPYLLFVGKLSGRHLIPRLIEAYAQARSVLDPPPRLLLVGPNVLGLDVAACARVHGVADLVVHLSHVPESDLPALYSGALAFAFPATEAEGFGLPLVEAMACGTPVLSTALGSVPEVTEDAALLVPTNEAGAGLIADEAPARRRPPARGPAPPRARPRARLLLAGHRRAHDGGAAASGRRGAAPTMKDQVSSPGLSSRIRRHVRLSRRARARPEGTTPPFLILFINSICNLKCEHCFYWRNLNRRDDLTFDEIVALSRELGPSRT